MTLDRKWFLKALGVQQFHKLLAGFDDKSAQAVCTFVYCEGPRCEPIVFQGRTDVRQSSIPSFDRAHISLASLTRRCRARSCPREDLKTSVSELVPLSRVDRASE